MEGSHETQQDTRTVGDDMTKQYVGMLVDSLQKKVQILDDIVAINKRQSDIIKAAALDEEAFDREAEKKDALITELDTLDDGFDRIFGHVEAELSTETGRKPYTEEIRRMKELITTITEKSMQIQAGEERNRKSLEAYFEKERAQIKTGRVGTKTAMNYYNNMKNRNYIPPHFLDSKN